MSDRATTGCLVVMLVAAVAGLGGCISLVRDSGQASDYCASAATTVVDLYDGTGSDWSDVYDVCLEDPNEPWKR